MNVRYAYWRISGFEYSPGDRLSWPRVFVVVLSSSSLVQGKLVNWYRPQHFPNLILNCGVHCTNHDFTQPACKHRNKLGNACIENGPASYFFCTSPISGLIKIYVSVTGLFLASRQTVVTWGYVGLRRVTNAPKGKVVCGA